MKEQENQVYKKIGLFGLFALGIFILGIVIFYKLTESSKHNQKTASRFQTIEEHTIKITPSPSFTPIPTKITTPTPIPLSKKLYVIALFGDSMIDTMGENLEYLDKALQVKYPDTDFKLYNYGIGSQNIETGIGRWDHDFSYQTRKYPSITNISADYIILGSFSYNPFFPHDKNKHFLLLNQLVERAKTSTKASIYLLAEIAPLYDNFGKGPHGPNMTIENAHDQADRILEQLEGVSGIAKSNGVGLIDAFTPTQVSGKYGKASFVNTDDGIHPSALGHEFVANLIVETMVLK